MPDLDSTVRANLSSAEELTYRDDTRKMVILIARAVCYSLAEIRDAVRSVAGQSGGR